MYVNISSLKALYFSTTIINDSVRDIIRPFFDLTNLLAESILTSIYISDKTIFLSIQQVEEIYKNIFSSTCISLNIQDIEKYIEYPKEITFLNFNNITEALTWNLSFKKFQKSYIKKDTYKKINKSDIPLLIENKKITSIDLELRYIGNIITPLEIGVTTFENGLVKNYHYAVEERIEKNNFIFGESTLFKENDFENILNDHIKDTDYVIGHALDSEFQFITPYEKLSYIFKDKIILDTSLSCLKEFKLTTIDRKFVENKKQISLKNSLNAFNIKFNCSELHNAGNDAAYSMLLFQKMILVKNQAFKIAPDRKKKITLK